MDKYSAWRHWENRWNRICATSFSISGATAVKNAPSWVTAMLAAITAAFDAAQTLYGPQKQAAGFKRAYRHLEKAMAKYRFDPSVTEADLGKAEAEAISMLE